MSQAEEFPAQNTEKTVGLQPDKSVEAETGPNIEGKPDASAIYRDNDVTDDILAQQDPEAVHPDHTNVNWNKETGEGFATEMDRHAVKAAQLHHLLPEDVDVENLIKGENKSGTNKDEFEKALQKPDAMQQMADQPQVEEEIKPATAEAVRQAAN
ncbi:hypothetical protein INT43_003809 [Umbelopsis isabellina]|uniref:Uncharacterized protein n=1 Tax=Mortierella isabellina TaxID=91625 RepID=A0A8H7UFS0_MORIS|nr:hypothetical protein INT43_003809 [Umbelopsis isabellina]